MFPFNLGDQDSIFKISSNYHIEIPEDLMHIMEINYDDPLRAMVPNPIEAAAAGNNQLADMMNPMPPFKFNSNKEGNPAIPEDEASRKKKHREIEKQRRMEMASLFGTLRSLLPLEFIRGKRSMPDQINEAVNYIRHLEAEIKELEAKRDKIKNTTNPTCQDSNQCGSNSSIVVFPSVDGVQIMIREGSREKGVMICCPLSAVMKLLAQEGVNVISCSTSRVEDRTIYKIHCEMNDVASLDLTKLRLRLEALVG